MFLLSLPVSHQFEQETLQGRELAEMADVLDLRRPIIPDFLPDRPLTFHWGWGTVQEEFLPEFEREGLGSFLTENNVGLFSFDLGPACVRSDYNRPLTPTLTENEIINRSAPRLDQVRGVYSGPLAAENYGYYPTGMYEGICRPDFIRRFLETFDLYMVLDLAHAQVTAANQGMDIHDYLREMPLERVKDVHLSRPHLRQAVAMDAHDAPEDEDFELLSFLLRLLPAEEPIHVAIEYYRDLEIIHGCYLRLKEILVKHNHERF